MDRSTSIGVGVAIGAAAGSAAGITTAISVIVAADSSQFANVIERVGALLMLSILGVTVGAIVGSAVGDPAGLLGSTRLHAVAPVAGLLIGTGLYFTAIPRVDPSPAFALPYALIGLAGGVVFKRLARDLPILSDSCMMRFERARSLCPLGDFRF